MSACLLSNTAPVRFRTSKEIVRLIGEFESCSLPRTEWTHAAHLTIALWYHLTAPLDVTALVRAGIKRYNEAHGIMTTPTSGYHETMTLFWIAIVTKYLRELPDRDRSFVALANGLLEKYGDKDLPITYYSHERLFSREARASWLAPDLRSFNV